MSTTRTSPSASSLRQQRIERVELPLADLTRRHERGRFDRRVETDERDGADAAHERKLRRRRAGKLGAKLVGPHVVGPAPDADIAAQAGVDVMIARHDRHVLGRAHRVQPRLRRLVLHRQPEIDEIARDGDMIGLVRQQVRDDEIERGARMGAPALALPVEVAEAALNVEVAQSDAGQRRKMHIRHVGKRDRFAHAGLGR